MKTKLSLLSLAWVCSLLSCESTVNNPLTGTWVLQSGMVVRGNDTTFTDYTQDLRFIKIINATHFAFLKHDLNGGKDSTTATYVAGGGTYQLIDDQYTEHLEFLNYREWEGNDFEFTVSFVGDTMVQQGIEKIESLGIEQFNIEKYIRSVD
ncbi:hypothetical protein N6H18_08320 [Reichenbachiella agarivorans]|uniref:Lipocalin-like domain-containing protein n=1 Tax=Reichenbachiella agarivorans TaxID=2979464 RepID=A0ABY6CTX7_9BACT|nr:hypothetical protein [Reichenbachiella agarivorans]UXP33948.1 hypothetical protein N6H18_08320 [Reichenbachiella agarivorans]